MRLGINWQKNALKRSIFPDYVMNSRTREAMDIIEAVSCVRFTSVLLKPDNNSWIHITNSGGIRECMHKPTYKGFEVVSFWISDI